MAKIPVKRLNTADFQEEDKALVEKLGYSINPFYDLMQTLFDKRISVEEHLLMQYHTVDVEIDSSGTPKFSLSVINSMQSFKGFIVIQAIDLTGSLTRPTATPFITWDIKDNLVNIQHIAGIPADKRFRLVLLALG